MGYIDYKFIKGIQKIQDKTGKKILKKIIQVYLEKAEESHKKIKSHYMNYEYDEVKNEAHKFKSSSGSLGALEVHSICSEIESQINSNQNPSNEVLEELIQKLEEKIGPTIDELKQIMYSEVD